jgi:hypothetical protein
MRRAAVLVWLNIAAGLPALAANPEPTTVTPNNDAAAEAPPPTAQPKSDSPAAATTATAPATTAPAAAAADADSGAAQLEKRMHAMGYTTSMQHGQKMFCRRDETLGTRLGGAWHCMTENEAQSKSRAQQDVELLQQRLMQACLSGGTRKPANCGG